MLHIDLPKAKAMMADAVKERGEDFIYVRPSEAFGCAYVHVDEQDQMSAGCIIGLALSKEGIALEKLHQWNYGVGVIPLLRTLNKLNLLTYTDGAALYLTEVQGEQDRGEKWGEAIKTASWVGEDA